MTKGRVSCPLYPSLALSRSLYWLCIIPCNHTDMPYTSGFALFPLVSSKNDSIQLNIITECSRLLTVLALNWAWRQTFPSLLLIILPPLCDVSPHVFLKKHISTLNMSVPIVPVCCAMPFYATSICNYLKCMGIFYQTIFALVLSTASFVDPYTQRPIVTLFTFYLLINQKVFYIPDRLHCVCD